MLNQPNRLKKTFVVLVCVSLISCSEAFSHGHANHTSSSSASIVYTVDDFIAACAPFGESECGVNNTHGAFCEWGGYRCLAGANHASYVSMCETESACNEVFCKCNLAIREFKFPAIAATDILITATFANDQMFPFSELATRLKVCNGTNFASLSNTLKADCVSRLISSDAHCHTALGTFVCSIGGVAIDTADIAFDCDQQCMSEINSQTNNMNSAMACSPSNTKADVYGFAADTCYTSAYCAFQADPGLESFGDFCPSPTGEFCCGSNTSRVVSSRFGASNMLSPITTRAAATRINHVTDMDIRLFYDLKVPAQLQLKVEVPYITSNTTMSYTDNFGRPELASMCPTTYMIDFLPPVDTEPPRRQDPGFCAGLGGASDCLAELPTSGMQKFTDLCASAETCQDEFCDCVTGTFDFNLDAYNPSTVHTDRCQTISGQGCYGPNANFDFCRIVPGDCIAQTSTLQEFKDVCQEAATCDPLFCDCALLSFQIVGYHSTTAQHSAACASNNGAVCLTGFAEREPWLPLTQFPSLDLVGRPRSTCGNYDMRYTDPADFARKFSFPDQNADSLAYGNPAAVTAGVWSTSQGIDGIPELNGTFWNKGLPVGDDGRQRLNYTVGSGQDGHFDILNGWAKCKRLSDDANLVRQVAGGDTTFINGVAYPVQSFEWTISVCSVGYFGSDCRVSSPKPQLYAKTCRHIPASFSVTPQQISHVVVTPVTAQLVSKTFLQSVDPFQGSCPPLHERVAITLNMVMFGTDYIVSTSNVHDLLSPADLFSDASRAQDFGVVVSTASTFEEYLTEKEALGTSVAEGVYVLDERTSQSGATSVYYRKFVIVTKCYNTDLRAGVRNAPNAFAEAVAGASPNVEIDLEVILEKVVSSSTVSNTLNLRILASKETFRLPQAVRLKQSVAVAEQKIYGSYVQAHADTGIGPNGSLPVGTIMTGNDQLCSKHQLSPDDSRGSDLTPNAVGACMLNQALPDWITGVAPGSVDLRGRTITYQLIDQQATQYTYGCFPDWIDVRTATLIDNVYVFTGAIPRMPRSESHESIFWFVQQGELETTQTLGGAAGELMADRFGTALFYYKSTSSGGSYVSTKSTQFRSAAFTENPSGCSDVGGGLKSSCNLVCFTLADGLLTDALGLSERDILVHHVSVAQLALTVLPMHRFAETSGRRRVLLESVGAAGLRNSVPGATSMLKINPAPNRTSTHAVDVEPLTGRDIDGPNNYAPIFFPICFLLIFSCMGAIGLCCIKTRYKSSLEDMYRPRPPRSNTMSNQYSMDNYDLKQMLLGRSVGKDYD